MGLFLLFSSTFSLINVQTAGSLPAERSWGIKGKINNEWRSDEILAIAERFRRVSELKLQTPIECQNFEALFSSKRSPPTRTRVCNACACA